MVYGVPTLSTLSANTSIKTKFLEFPRRLSSLVTSILLNVRAGYTTFPYLVVTAALCVLGAAR